MRKFLIALGALLVSGAMIVEDAEAKRLGGARSSGVQRSATSTPPASTPAKPAQQQPAAGQQAAGPQQAAPAAGAAGAAAAPASGMAKWGPLLGGLAIGGLLGALFSGNGLGGLLLLVLLAIAAVMVFRMLARRQQPAPRTMQYAGMNERVSMSPSEAPASASARAPAPAVAVPAGFDSDAFLRGAKLNFVKLQVANDAGNLNEIREFTTPAMFEVLEKDLAERGGERQQTDVMSLNADLVEVATEGDRHWASVRFSGLVRETPGSDPVEFQEIWNLAKPVDGSTGWLLAGIQQLQ